MGKLDEFIKKRVYTVVRYLPFGEVATIVRGASPRPIKDFITEDTNGVNWIKIGDVTPGSKYITKTEEKITLEGAKKSRFVKEGDFVLSNSMSFGRPYILQTKGCIHDGWLAISDFEDTFIPDFLYHILSSNKYQQIMRQKAGSGGGVQNLNADIVRNIELPVIPIEVQKEIVRILDEYSEKNAQLIDALNAELEARKVQYEYYRDLIFGFDGSITKLPISELIISLKTGLNPRKNFKLNEPGSKFPYITGKDIFNNKVNVTPKTDLITEEAVNLINRRACLEDGLLLFASTGTGTVGRMAIIESYNNDWNMSETLYAIKVKEDLLTAEYLMHVLYSNVGRKQFDPKITKGSVPHLKVADLMSVLIPIPSLRKQKEIVKKIEALTEVHLSMNSSIANEIKLRQTQYNYYRDKLLTFKEAN